MEHQEIELDATTIKFHLFVDVSSVEIFINDGLEVAADFSPN